MQKSKDTIEIHSLKTKSGRVSRPNLSRLNKTSSAKVFRAPYSPVSKPITVDGIYKQQALRAALSGAIAQLAASIAASDDPINEQEMQSFSVVFTDYLSEQWDMVDVLKGASAAGGYSDQVLQRIQLHIGEDLRAYRKLMNHLFEFALCDGPLKANEIVLLNVIFSKLPIHEESFDAYLRYYIIPDISSDQSALGLPKRVKDMSVIKAAYHRELRKYHPDHFTHNDSMGCYIHVLNERAGFLHEAYKRLAEK